MDNPYRYSEHAAETLDLVSGKQLRYREVRDGAAFTRQWRVANATIGWHGELLRYANLFRDAGLIDHTRELTHAHWALVYLTDAGVYLRELWRNSPFEVIETADVGKLINRAAGTLSAAYVEESGLLEDQVDRYTGYLRPHAERVVRELLG